MGDVGTFNSSNDSLWTVFSRVQTLDIFSSRRHLIFTRCFRFFVLHYFSAHFLFHERKHNAPQNRTNFHFRPTQWNDGTRCCDSVGTVLFTFKAKAQVVVKAPERWVCHSILFRLYPPNVRRAKISKKLMWIERRKKFYTRISWWFIVVQCLLLHHVNFTVKLTSHKRGLVEWRSFNFFSKHHHSVFVGC